MVKDIKVISVLSCDIFSYGLASLLNDTHGITVCEILKTGQTFSDEKFNSLSGSIILTDFTCLYNALPSPGTIEPWPKIILLDTNCGRDNITVAIIKKKLHGVINSNSGKDAMIKAIRMVSKGELWFDNETVKGIISGVKAIKDGKFNVLTIREREIVSLTGKGFRNKEMAKKLHISETTVKTHLYRIFQKLNIKTRSELIAFALRFGEPQTGPAGESMLKTL